MINLTAELGGQGLLNTRLTASHQPGRHAPLRTRSSFGVEAASDKCVVREMLARLDNRWIGMAAACAGFGSKGLKHAVSHNRFAFERVRG